MEIKKRAEVMLEKELEFEEKNLDNTKNVYNDLTDCANCGGNVRNKHKLTDKEGKVHYIVECVGCGTKMITRSENPALVLNE